MHAEHAEIKAHIIGKAVDPDQAADLFQTADRVLRFAAFCESRGFLYGLYPAEQFRKLQKASAEIGVCDIRIHELFHAEAVLVLDQRAQTQVLLRRQSGLFHQTAVKPYIAHLHLEFLQAGSKKALDGQKQDLHVSVRRIVPDQLDAGLDHLAHAALVIVVILEDAACVAEPDSVILVPEELRGSPGHCRRHVRTQHQGPVVPVKELVHFPGGDSSSRLIEHVKELKARCVDAFISEETELMHHVFLYFPALSAFLSVNIPDSVRSMKQCIHKAGPLYFRTLPCYQSKLLLSTAAFNNPGLRCTPLCVPGMPPAVPDSEEGPPCSS